MVKGEKLQHLETLEDRFLEGKIPEMNDYFGIQIPDYKPFTDAWKKIPVRKSSYQEPLLCASSVLADAVFFYSEYYRFKYDDAPRSTEGKSPLVYGRLSVVNMLAEAAEIAKYFGVKLRIRDISRTFESQRYEYNQRKAEVRAQFPEKPEDWVIQETEKAISYPSENAPHLSGGAVDVDLVDAETGETLDLGLEFGKFHESMRTDYFKQALKKPGLSDELRGKYEEINNNRTLLYYIMTRVGFTNYPEEYWHFDYGNKFWAFVNNMPEALYGMVDEDVVRI